MVGLDKLHRKRPALHRWPISSAVFDEFTLTHPGQRDRFGPRLDPQPLSGRECVHRRASCQRRPPVDVEVLNVLPRGRHRRRRPPPLSFTVAEGVSPAVAGGTVSGFRCVDAAGLLSSLPTGNRAVLAPASGETGPPCCASTSNSCSWYTATAL